MNINRPLYVICFTALLTAAFTGAVMTVQQVSAEKIQQNEDLRFEKALVEVFALAKIKSLTDEQAMAIIKRRIELGPNYQDPQTRRVFRLIRAYSRDAQPGRTRDDSDLLGIAIQVSGRGFWAPITGLLALTPDLSKVMGVVFLDHKETPGLGGRISEPWFQQQFIGLNVSPVPAGRKFIYILKHRPKDPADPRYDRSIDAITGATQTSRAVEKFMNETLRQFRRAIQAGPISSAEQTSP